MKRFKKNSALAVIISVLFLSAIIKTYAVPSTYFTAGQTLDPVADDITCAPGVCSVYPISIGDPVGTGDDNSVLFIDTNGDIAEDSANFYFNDSTDTLYTDDITLANNLEITTTTSSTVGVVTKDATRFLHTYKPAGTNDNLFFGKGSGNFTLSATSNFNANTGIGENTLANLSTGYFNTALGTAALRSTTTGNNNTAVGLQAGNRISSGTYNIAIGRDALYGAASPFSASGSYNIAVGSATLYALLTGENNVALGHQAGLNSSSASNNVFIGYEAGHDITTESGNIFIGYQAGADATGSDQLYIENSNSPTPLIFGDFANDYVNINGRLGVGTSPLLKLDVAGSGRFTGSATSVLTGSIDPTASTTVTGVGTLFSTELVVGDRITVSGESRTVTAIASDTSLTVDTAFTDTADDVSPDKLAAIFVTRASDGTLAMVQNNFGNFGLGTSSPDFEVEIVSATQNVEIVSSGYNGRKPVFAGRSANGTEASPSATSANDILAEFAGQGYGTTGFAPSTTAGIRVVAEEAFDDAGYGSQLLFRTTPNNSTTLKSRMVIMADGNVGIGDTTPDDLLNLESSTNTGISISAIGADVDPYVKFELVDGTSSFIMGIDDSDSDSFKISTTALGTSDRFIIDSSGNINVGGDTTPGSLFSVGSTSQFQVGSSGSIDAVTTIMTSGAVTIASSGTGVLNVGTTAGTYRTTNAGGNISPQAVFDVDNSNSSSGSQAYIFDTTNGFVFSAANGTRRIARASIDIINLTNTAGSETGDLAFFTKPSGSAITEKMRIDSTGKVGIGDISPDYLLDIENTGSDTDIFALTDSDGSCLHNPEAGAESVTCSSDERLKENITDADESLPYLMDFRIREYDVRASGDHMMGVIAQEIMEIHPELVAVGGNGYYTVELPSTWAIVKGIQELNLKVEDISSLSLENENTLGARLVAWFADSANGIQTIFANVIHTNKVETNELCVGEVCVTEEQFLEIVGNQNNNPSPISEEVNIPSEEGDIVPQEETVDENVPPSEEEVPPEETLDENVPSIEDQISPEEISPEN